MATAFEAFQPEDENIEVRPEHKTELSEVHFIDDGPPLQIWGRQIGIYPPVSIHYPLTPSSELINEALSNLLEVATTTNVEGWNFWRPAGKIKNNIWRETPFFRIPGVSEEAVNRLNIALPYGRSQDASFFVEKLVTRDDETTIYKGPEVTLNLGADREPRLSIGFADDTHHLIHEDDSVEDHQRMWQWGAKAFLSAQIELGLVEL